MIFQDYEEFIAALNEHGVRYLIVGAHALAYHVRPRATKDLDILLEPTAINARKTLQALRDFFGGVDVGYTIEDFTDTKWIIQLGVAPLRIDLMTELMGCSSFSKIWKNRVTAKFGSVKTHYLGLKELIQSKKAVGRAQDKADLQSLRKIRSR